MGLQVALPQAGPGSEAQLGQAVDGDTEHRCRFRVAGLTHLGEPQHRSPALGQAPVGRRQDRQAGARLALGHRGAPEIVAIRSGRRVTAVVRLVASGCLERRGTGRRQQRRLELLRAVEPRRTPWPEHADEGVGHSAGRFPALAGDGKGDLPGRADVPPAQVLEGGDTFVLGLVAELRVAGRRAGGAGELCRLAASRDLH